MDEFTKTDLEEARRALSSLLSKCEKAQQSIAQRNAQGDTQGITRRSSQGALLKNRIRALQVALALIEKSLG